MFKLGPGMLLPPPEERGEAGGLEELHGVGENMVFRMQWVPC